MAAQGDDGTSRRKATLIRLDPRIHAAVRRWADDELRSFNAQVEYLLRRALRESGRLPGSERRGRPRQERGPA